MTTKEKILTAIQSLADDVSIEHVIDRLELLCKVELGIQQADAGDAVEHDAFMKQLEDNQAD